eukprot:jgi/Tetstr1/448232/TSEL_035520.t1
MAYAAQHPSARFAPRTVPVHVRASSGGFGAPIPPASRPTASRLACPALQAPPRTAPTPPSTAGSCSRVGHPVEGSSVRNAPSAMPTAGPDGTQARWRRWDWAAGYASGCDCPEGYWMEVTGRLPPELEGTYIRNGPGKLDVGGRDRVAHPFDADGLVMSIAIRDGRAFFRSRFIETAEFVAERKAGRRLFRGSFGSRLAGGFWSNFLEIAPRNAANTNIVCWGDRCLALFEAGQPYRFDASTLETHGVDTLGGALAEGLPFTSGLRRLDGALGGLLDAFGVASPLAEGVRLGGDAFSAHPHACAATGRTVTYSYRIKLAARGLAPGLRTVFTFYELGGDGAVLERCEYALDGYAFVHDFGVTAGHYVLVQNPVALELAPFLMGTRSAVECVRFEPERPTLVHLIPRPGSAPASEPEVLSLDPCFVFHISEAHEDAPAEGPTTVTVDCVRYPEMPDFQDLMGHGAGFEYVRPEAQPKSELWRLVLRKGARAAEATRVTERALEFPSPAPSAAGPPTHTFAAAALHPTLNMPQQALARIDMATGATQLWGRGERYYVGEPRFVARDGADRPDDGWLVAMCFDAAKGASEFVVLDAADLTAGPVAVCRLREPMPHGLHGEWLSGYHGPAETAEGQPSL